MNMNNDTIDVIQCLLSCPMTDSFECESTLQIFMIRFPNDNNYHHGDLVRFLFICSIVHLGPVHLLLSNLQMIDHYLSLPLRHFLICILAQELPPSLSLSFQTLEICVPNHIVIHLCGHDFIFHCPSNLIWLIQLQPMGIYNRIPFDTIEHLNLYSPELGSLWFMRAQLPND